MRSRQAYQSRPLLFVLLAWFLPIISCGAQSMALSDSDRIVFFGDSITELGEHPKGYVALIKDSLEKQYRGIAIIGAGISGNRVPQLQDRLERDVVSKKPTVVVIYIGINDVWHFDKHGTGTPKDRYDSGLRHVISKIQRSGARIVLCTPSVIGEKRHGENKFDAMLDEYSDISRRVAKELGARVCDLRETFIHYLAAHNLENKEEGVLTVDSVHLNDAGNRLVANTILKALAE
jgi:lysophospholipase L1-like esterase